MTPDAQLLLDDEAARNAALDVTRSFIVQAPAGSGKTELLIQRYLKLLTTVDNPEEVLAITFTLKASAEMQLRVLQALQRAERREVPTESHEMITAAAALSVLQRDQKLQWNLITNPRRMRIQTLDSLNAAIARTQPLTSAGGAAGSAIVADAEMRMLYRDAATLTLDQLLETGPMHEATEQVLQHVDNSTALYVDYLARMLAARDQWLPFIGGGSVDSEQENQLRTRLEANLEGAVVEHLERTAAALPADCASSTVELANHAAGRLRDAGDNQNPICALHGLAAVPDADAAFLPQWLGLAELLLTKTGSLRKKVIKNQGFPQGDDEQKASMDNLLVSLHGQPVFCELLHDVRILPPVRYNDEQWRVLLALFRLLPLAATELKRLFSEKVKTDFVEVALTAGNALGTADNPGDVALILDYQLRHLLVDEMQDTSSAQYRMLEALTGGWEEGDGRTLFCVGDPMQSIYRFRNAEVGQFLLAKHAGIGNVKLHALTLRRNFRSGEHLVDWFNDVFPGVLAAHDDSRRSAVAYSTAVSVQQLKGQGRCLVHPLFGSSPAAEADAGCQIIRQTLDEYSDGDMAVLVRSRTHLPVLLARLRAAGIAYRAVEIDRLTDLPEIIDILALTRALDHPGDRLAWLALLRSPWVGLDWSDLHALVKGEPNATVWELLGDDGRLSNMSDYGSQAVAEFRTRILQAKSSARINTLRDRVEEIWLTLGGPAILDDHHAVENVYRFLDVIEDMEVAGTLPDVAVLEGALDLERVSSNVNARLQIMTMHRAKGLQFDHVLLYGLGHAPGRNEKTVLSWFDIPGEHGADEKIISPVGPRVEVENDPVHRFIQKIESKKDRHELGRLLYVACTRARRTLHLLGHVAVAADGQKYRTPRAQSLLNLLWPSVSAEFEQAFQADAKVANGEDRESWLQPELRRFESPWSLPGIEALPGMSELPGAVEEERSVEFYWVGMDARVAGTVVHRWLQMAADRRVHLTLDTLASMRAVSARWLREMGVGDTSIETVVQRVESALKGVLDDDKGRWLLEGEGHAELKLSGVYQDRVESVVLDRVRIDEDGTHWIVDYKTSSHEGGDLESFLKAESDRYRPQLSKYAELYRNYSGAPVRCALYFPLLQEFVEVTL